MVDVNNQDGQSAVVISLNQLQNNTVAFDQLEDAFGVASLGIVVVKDLPSNFAALRHRLLSYASALASLPDEILENLESPAAKWLVGWSCGKETLKDGRYDSLKGSYYVNCAAGFTAQQRLVAEKYPGFPEYTAPNIWPPEEVLPGFEQAFQDLCALIVDVAVLVARACDRYAEAKIQDYQKGYLEHIVKTSVSTKARLLHYFPTPQSSDHDDDDEGETAIEQDSWCATHRDHGCLTGLTSAMFVDEALSVPKTGAAFALLDELDKPPDPQAGLYIQSREGVITKVCIPRDCLAFQTGEALEIITRGRFKAVPHFVQGIKPRVGGKVARNTLAVFTQPNLWERVDERRDFARFAKEVVEQNH